ncbi:MAG: serine/threonine-protein kinase PknK [Solirubrobacteraceae bacterium]
MGLVYRAWQLRPERMVAVKVIMPELAGDPDFRARFEQEASLAAQIEHPNVIPIYGVGEEDGLLFIVMRFVESMDLGVLLRRRERFAPAHAARLVGQVAAALDAAHERGLVHRDVKPANVLVTADEHLYLTDFGLTKRVADFGSGGMTATGGFVGTLDYIAPEQVSGEPVDGRGDVYALGCVLYQLLTGVVPFPRDVEVAKIFAHMSLAPPVASMLAPGVSGELDAVVARAMAKDPADRYQSAGDLGRAAAVAAGRGESGVGLPLSIGDGAAFAVGGVAAATRPKPDGPVPLPPFVAAVAEREFVGREPVLGALRATWERIGAAPGLAFVTGDAGMGKTSISAHFAREVHAAGAAVLYGRSDEEAVSSYQPFVEALGEYLDHVSVDALIAELPAESLELGRLIPRLGVRPAGITAVSPDAGDDRYRLFEAVCAVLRRLSASRPVLLLIDDLHWSDKPTLSLLRHVLRSLSGCPLMVVGTFRELDASAELGGLLADLRREHRFTELPLTGFDMAETERLLSADTGLQPRPTFVRKLLSHTGGNPFFIDQMLRSLGGTAAAAALSGREITALGVPQGVKEVILRRLAPLGKPGIDLLAAAAVAGQRFRLGVLEAVLGKDAETLLETLDELIAMGVVSEVPGEIDSFSFTHNLVRETQYEGLSASRRVRLHAAIGRTLEAAGASAPAELAHHYFEARQLVGPEPSIGFSVEAARRASTSLAHEEAIEHYERALAAMELAESDDRRRSETMLELGDALERVHEIDRAREAYVGAAELARQLDAPELLARAALGFAKWQRYGVLDREAIRLLETALAGLPEAAAVPRAETLALLANRLDPLESQDRREALLDEALGLARGFSSPATLDSILRIAPWVRCRPESLGQRLELAVEAVALAARERNEESMALGQLHRFRALFELGRTGEATAGLDAYAESLAGLHQPWFEWTLLVIQTMLRILDGRPGSAGALLGRARALEQAADPDAIESSAMQGFLIAHATDRYDEADEEALRRCTAMYPSKPIWSATFARLLIGLGRDDEARVELELCARGDFALIPATQDWLATMVLLAESAHALADEERAAGIYRLLTPFAERTALIAMDTWACWGSVSRPLGLLAQTAGAAEAAAAHLERALHDDRDRRCVPWFIRGAVAYRDLVPGHLRTPSGQALVEEALSLARERELPTAAGPVAPG